MTEASYVAKALALTRKDLRVEYRARETLPPMLAFVFAVSVILSFTLPTSGALRAPADLPAVGTVRTADVLSGFVWITILFAGLIGFARTFESERHDGAIDALLLTPLDRSGLWLAKAIANLTFVAIVEVFLMPVIAIFFGIPLADDPLALIAVIVLVDLGFVAAGTLFAALAAGTRSRELMLPVLALPALVPVFLAAVELTAGIFVSQGLGSPGGGGWLAILAIYDAVAIATSVMVFEFVID